MATGINPDIRYCSQCGQPRHIEELARFGGALICPDCATPASGSAW
jgi:recombinational DNA repair protein (RecF pathway)